MNIKFNIIINFNLINLSINFNSEIRILTKTKEQRISV